MDTVRQTFRRSPRKSTRHASQQLAIPQSTMRKTVRKRLRLKCYTFKNLQQFKPDVDVKRSTSCAEMMEKISVEDYFLANFVSNDEATFHLSGTVSRHCVRIWGKEQTVTDTAYLDMMELWLMPQLEETMTIFFFQQDGAPHHFYCKSHNF
jgi:hypothetical protein